MSSPPTTLGQFQIIREIARSNDIVYEAYDPLMNRRVAVKELSVPAGTTLPQQEDRIRRFKREAEAAGTLNHANIMTVYSFAEDAGRTFMAMEYLDGCTLRNELDTKGAVPLERAIDIANQLLEGLGHAHSKGVIHRDIKPDNIQLLSTGAVKITDFGIARLTFQPNLTMDGQVFGTPSYMSPEQVVGKEIDARSDLFSVGVVLYEMLAGSKPFTGDSVVAITYAIMNKAPEQPPNIAPGMWQVLARMLDKTPHLRYGTALDVIHALRDATRPSAIPPQIHATHSSMHMTAQPMANMTPYGTPNPMAPQPIGSAPPPVYQFNPYMQPGANPSQVYQNQMMQTQMQAQLQAQAQMHPQMQPYYQQSPTMMPPGPIPVYYPPPPRTPLLKPDQIIFMKRMGAAVLILGSIFALVIVIINAIVSTKNNVDAEHHDNQLQSDITQPNSNFTIDERITEQQALLSKAQTQLKRDSMQQNLAVLYETRGLAAASQSSLDSLLHAEHDFEEAAKNDPANPAYPSDLGKLFAQQAEVRGATDYASRADLLQKSGANWKLAADLTKDPRRRTSFMEASADAFYKAASNFASAGDRREARRALEQAKLNATPGTELANQIDATYNQFEAVAGG